MKNIIAGMVIAAALSGCATKTIPLTSSTANAYRGKSITYSVHPKADFNAFTADKAMFGAVGGASAISKGNKLITENNVPDPAVGIGSAIANDLAGKYNLIVKKPTQITTSRKTNEIAEDYSDADLVIDVQTRNWGFYYFPTDWSHYHIMYSANLQLIDTKKKSVLAAGAVSYDSKDHSKHPSYGQLTNDNAAGLKQESAKARDNCIAESKQRIFNAK